jgi:hypothetical protein
LLQKRGASGKWNRQHDHVALGGGSYVVRPFNLRRPANPGSQLPSRFRRALRIPRTNYNLFSRAPPPVCQARSLRPSSAKNPDFSTHRSSSLPV